ncbi:MAG: SCO family protein [Gammaproteobacteria bacterium]|nr:SCO family protein [Gammaproteobacteria bacterium]
MAISDKKNLTFLIMLVVVSVSILIVGNFLYASIKKPVIPQNLTASTLYPSPKQLGHFSLLQANDEGVQEFDTQKLQGQWHLVFMGYTSCPHICPTEMHNLSELYQKLPSELQKQVQIIMVTTDPLKDTPGVLKSYVKKYHSDFIGLSGTKNQIGVFAKQFAMPFLPSEETDKNKQYEVNHSASIYLTNPDGELYAVFSTPHDVNNMHADLLQIITL